MKNIFILTFLFAIACSEFNADTNRNKLVSQAIETINTSIEAKGDTVAQDSLMARLADNFNVGTFTESYSRKYINYLFQHEISDSIVLQEIIDQAGHAQAPILAKVQLKHKGKQLDGTIAFNGECKILYMDFADAMFKINRNTPSKLLAVIPFTLSDQSIILTIRLNDYEKPLRFLFDSGADGMAIGKDLAQEIALPTHRQQNVSVVGGEMDLSISEGNTVYIDTLQLNKQNIAIFPTVNEKYDGIIGLNLVQKYICKFDFDKQQLFLYSLGIHDYGSEGDIVAVRCQNNVIQVPGSIDLTGDKAVSGNFVIDTGADFYCIGFSSFVRKNKLLLSGFKPEGQKSVMSMGVLTPLFYGVAKSFTFGSLVFQNMPIDLQASTGGAENRNQFVAGSIGIKLLSQYNFTINLLSKEMHFIPRK